MFEAIVKLAGCIVATSLACDTAVLSAPLEKVVSCLGPFAKNSSHAKLVQTFGSRDVVYRRIQGAEGERNWASVLHANNPKDRLEFIWKDEKRRQIPLIRIRQGSVWRASNGMHLGMTLTEVERLNGKSFRLSGFGWDYGGRVTDWKGGALSRRLPGGCRVDVNFYPASKAPDKALASVSGEESFSSDNPGMRASKPTVKVIFVYFPG